MSNNSKLERQFTIYSSKPRNSPDNPIVNSVDEVVLKTISKGNHMHTVTGLLEELPFYSTGHIMIKIRINPNSVAL